MSQTSPRRFGARAKLSLTAVALVSVVYAVLGATVFFVARQTILNSVDTGLLKGQDGFLRGRRGRPMDDRPRHHPPPDFDRPALVDGPGGRDSSQGPRDNGRNGGADRGSDGPGRDGPPPDQQRVEGADVHDSRPRMVWTDGTAHFPFPMSVAIDPGAVDASRHGSRTLRTVKFNGEPVKVFTFPMRAPGDDHRIEAVVQVSYWMGDIDKSLDTLATTLLLILPVGMIVMGLASMVVVGRTLRPVRDIGAAAARIEAEDLSGRLPVSGSDEFSELAETMNGMLGRLDVAFADQRATLEQLKTVIDQQRRFTADASHELKTPLAVVKVHAGLLKGAAKGDADSMESIDAIDLAVNRMARLVQDLLLLARTDAGQLQEQFSPVDLADILRRSASMGACPQKIRLVESLAEIEVMGSKFALERLIGNLIDNACRHTEDVGNVRVSSSVVGGFVKVQVADDGEGIPADQLGRIFERFHRVDSSRQSDTGGSGLGLAICKGIVEAHGGTIEVQSQFGDGATFTVSLPVAA